MKRIAAVLTLLALGAIAPASAHHNGTDTFVATGDVLVGNPGTRVILGVSEQDNPCTGIDPDIPQGTFSGVDGVWVALPADAPGHPATLDTSGTLNDVDAWFYDDGCNLIRPPVPGAYDMATDGNESGTVPDGAAYVVVDLYTGANASFTLKVFNLKLS